MWESDSTPSTNSHFSTSVFQAFLPPVRELQWAHCSCPRQRGNGESGGSRQELPPQVLPLWGETFYCPNLSSKYSWCVKETAHICICSPGLCSASLHRSGRKWLLSIGWSDPVYEVPHPASQASCAVIGWSSVTLFNYEPNPKSTGFTQLPFLPLQQGFIQCMCAGVNVNVLSENVCMQIQCSIPSSVFTSVQK